MDVFELSIVFANALENAIHMVKELPEDQRRIICRSVTHPRFIMEISNSYAGKIIFDKRGVPVVDKLGYGIGTRSIVAFAEKNNALCLFRAEKGGKSAPKWANSHTLGQGQKGSVLLVLSVLKHI